MKVPSHALQEMEKYIEANFNKEDQLGLWKQSVKYSVHKVEQLTDPEILECRRSFAHGYRKKLNQKGDYLCENCGDFICRRDHDVFADNKHTLCPCVDCAIDRDSWATQEQKCNHTFARNLRDMTKKSCTKCNHTTEIEAKIRTLADVTYDIRYESAPGVHTYSMCECGRRMCRRSKCLVCLDEEMRQLMKPTSDDVSLDRKEEQ